MRLTFEVVLQEIQDGTFPLLTNYLPAQNLFQKSSGTESQPRTMTPEKETRAKNGVFGPSRVTNRLKTFKDGGKD